MQMQLYCCQPRNGEEHPMTTALQSADQQIWRRVITLHGRIEQELAKALHRKHGLGLSEYRALASLAVADDSELRIQELADAVGLNQSSASRLAARLEAAELTRRTFCESDRRGVYTQLTADGRLRLHAATPTYEATLTAAIDKAAADPALADLVKLLRDTAR
jgi:DNA-binding MarR family transcriptional regulator